MPDILYTFLSQPGVRRDGTELDSPYYADGVWVRWQRGKPRKMGGYRATSLQANGPVRHVVVDARNGAIKALYMCLWGIQRQAISASGAAGALDDRTPLVFAPNSSYTWSSGFMYSSTGGAYTALLTCATPDGDAIDSDATGNIYVGDANTGDPMTVVANGGGAIAVSGGVTVLQPFLVAYGSHGLIMNSNPNDFSVATGWTNGGGNQANTANVAGTKIVYGAPIRGGQNSPAGLFWALDSLIRMTFTGGTTIWNYDPIATPASPLSKRAIVELDGKFIWPAIDRFLMYTGIVQELPNDMNQNWFFNNLNFDARNKVWGTKITRFGEIWWFYPRGTATECTDAIIFNYRENTWYDAHLVRSAGDKAGTFRYPVWCGAEDGIGTTKLTTGTRAQTSAQTNAGLASPVQNPGTSSATGGTGLLSGQPYFYKITALSAAGESLASNEISVTTAGGIVAPTSTTISTTNTGGTALNAGTAYFYKVTALNGVGETTPSAELSITTAPGIANPTATTLTTTSSGGTLAGATQYFYKVTAVNALGETMGSNELNVTTATALSAPTLNTPTSVAGGSLASATTYYYKVTAINGVGETLPSSEQSFTTSSNVTAPVASAASYTIDGQTPGVAASLTPGTTYYYKVTTVAAGGESVGSNEISVAVPAQIGAPTFSVGATTISGGTLPLDTYDCYIATRPFASSFINTDATFMGTVTTTSGNQSITFTYNLSTRDDGGYIALIKRRSNGDIWYSGTASGVSTMYITDLVSNWTSDGGIWPLTNDTAKGYVSLSWGAVGGATSYNLYRGTAAGAENLEKSVGNVTSYSDRGDGTSSGSPPAAGRSVALSWAAVTGATGYKVYRGTSAGAENKVQSPGNVTSFTDDGTGFATTGSPPGSNTTVKPSNTLSWNAVTGAASYNVYRGTAAGSENVKYALGNVLTYLDTGSAGTTASPPGSNTTGGLSVNTVNWNAVSGATGYRVYRGTSSGGENVYYALGTVTSFADGGAAPSGSASPPGTNTTASTTSSNSLSWSAVAGATGYRVYRGTTSGGESAFYAPGNVTTYTDTGAASSAGTPPLHNTTSPVLTFSATPAGVVAGMTVYADPYLPPGTTVVSTTATTVTLTDSPSANLPSGSLVAFSTQNAIIMANGQTVTGVTSGAVGTIVRTSYTDLNLQSVTGTFTSSENLTVSSGQTAKCFAAPVAQQLDAVYEHEFGFDKIVSSTVTPIRSSFTSQNYGFAVGAPFADPVNGQTQNLMTRITRIEPDFNLIGGATLIVEGRSFAQQANKELNRYAIVAGQEFQSMREQERILRITLESNTTGGFYEQGQVLMTLEPGDERSDIQL